MTVIDTREELIVALREASEVEHGLMIQYLFAALTCKKDLAEGLSTAEQALVREWEGTILRVAVEEMGHLGTVTNMLSAIGAPPHFRRPNFPQQTGYYPFAFDLLPFGEEALYRFQIFELPRGFPPPEPPGLGVDLEAADVALLRAIPEPLEYTFVGELYEKIREGFLNIPERALFVGLP
jgi:rubrerythrin